MKLLLRLVIPLCVALGAVGCDEHGKRLEGTPYKLMTVSGDFTGLVLESDTGHVVVEPHVMRWARVGDYYILERQWQSIVGQEPKEIVVVNGSSISTYSVSQYSVAFPSLPLRSLTWKYVD